MLPLEEQNTFFVRVQGPPRLRLYELYRVLAANHAVGRIERLVAGVRQDVVEVNLGRAEAGVHVRAKVVR